MDLFSEVEAAQWALCLDFKPLDATLHVEVMLLVACEHYNLVVWAEVDQADRAVWHIRIFLLVLQVTHVL